MKRGAWMLSKTVSILLHSCVPKATDTETATGNDADTQTRVCSVDIFIYYFYYVFIIARRVNYLAQYKEI